MEDLDLIERHLAGDEEAFNALVTRYQERLYRLAYRMVGNHDDALDAVQEALLRLLSALPRFRPEAKFSTWLYRLASNTYIDLVRKRTRCQRGEATEAVLPEAPGGADPQTLCEHEFREYLIDQALQELPEAQRILVVLRDREGLSTQEAADVLGIETGTLKARLHRARGALRRVLEEGLSVPGMEGLGRFHVTPGGGLS